MLVIPAGLISSRYICPSTTNVQVTKLNFSEAERNALEEKEFFLLKSSATKKIVELFGEMELRIKEELENYDFDIEGLNVTTGKIFRGENYRLFPYVVLDYPKLFSTRTVFAFRTMFWWGHEMSFTLHLQGEAWERYRKVVKKNAGQLTDREVFYCVNESPWQYNFETDNYLPVGKTTDGLEKSLDKNFMKLSRKIPLSRLDEAVNVCVETFRLFADLLDSERTTNR